MAPDRGLHVVILAGGIGARLWPISRRSRPKQFQPLLSHRTLLEETYLRIEPLSKPDRTWVVTGGEFVDLVHAQLPHLPLENILGEPIGRNSAPAAALAVARIARTQPNALVLVTPADSFIGDAVAYRDYVGTAVEAAEGGFIAVLGVMPSHPETGYGYIQRGERLRMPASGAYRVARFTEKPDEQTAERYLAHGGYYWNMGQFIFQAEHFMERCALHLPEVASAAHTLGDPDVPTGDLIEQLYRDLPSISIDYGIAEQEEDMAVVPTALEWSDVGSWRAVKEIVRRRGPLALQGENHIQVGAKNSLVVTRSGRLVVTVGVEGCVIVDTDDALLIVQEDSAQQVRDALEEIARRGKEEHL
jgi:mannose-1-phosphate guanylyltransferase/mannose-6-phosphate isomerase